jgi:hypothetical protein
LDWFFGGKAGLVNGYGCFLRAIVALEFAALASWLLVEHPMQAAATTIIGTKIRKLIILDFSRFDRRQSA